MANELIKQNYKDIANAIRSKTGKNNLMTAEEMPAEIEGIEVGIIPSGNKPITTTGQVDVENFATAQVQENNLVASNIKKDVSILGVNGTYEGYPEPSGKAPTITENGTNINIKDYATVDVEVQGGGGETFEGNYIYLTDEEGNIDSEHGIEQQTEGTIYYVAEDGYSETKQICSQDGMSPFTLYTYSAPSIDSTPFREVSVQSGYLYYYGGDLCSPFDEVSLSDRVVCYYKGEGEFLEGSDVSEGLGLIWCDGSYSLFTESIGYLDVDEETEVTINEGTYKITRIS